MRRYAIIHAEVLRMKAPISLKITPESKEKLREIAAKNHRSMAEQVEYWIDLETNPYLQWARGEKHLQRLESDL